MNTNSEQFNGSTPAASFRIPMPIEHIETNIVENVYADALETPDYLSQDVATAYLQSRLHDEHRISTRIIATPTGRTLPKITRVEDGVRAKKRWEREGWIINPCVSAGIILGSLAISVGPTVVLDIADEAKVLGHDVYRSVHGPDYASKTIIQATSKEVPTSTIVVDAEQGNRAGSSSVNEAAVKRFAGKVKIELSNGGIIQSIDVAGRSSDDYGTNDSIGRPEPTMQDFAKVRAEAYAKALRQELPNEEITIQVDQDVLTKAQKAQVEKVAIEAGFKGQNNIIAAIRDVEAGKKTNSKLANMINRLFTSKRGVTMEAVIQHPGSTKYEYAPKTVQVELPDNPPQNPDRDYSPWILPIPPIPRLRRKFSEFVPKKRWAKVPGRTIYKYGLLREEEDEAWVQVRPEAMQDDKTLVKNPWAYTRLYEHIMRDDRIAEMLRADYKGKDGDEKSIRLMFIDKSPAPETIAKFSELLTTFAQMDDGKIADRISGIFVYPSENAGREHNDPKRIGMGVDKQSSKEILGTYTPILDLVEMHMPSTWDKEVAEAMLKSFCGPAWTLAHEVGGHGTDDTDAKIHLQRVLARGVPNAHLIASGDNPWARRMARIDALQRNLPADDYSRPSFEIIYPVVDREGNVVTISGIAMEGDPRLSHATDATIVGFKPTRYGSTNELENYAETTAAMITDIEIPFTESGVTTQNHVTDLGQTAVFATGYRPDKAGQAVVTEAVGAVSGKLPLEFAEPVPVDISQIHPHNDPLIREQMIRARSSRFPRPSELISILTQVRPNKGKK